MRSILLPLLLCAAAASAADAVDGYTGTFSTQVPIAVPAFHGLEPSLQLVYSSSGGNGLAGIGWSLQGFSSIERVSAKRGVPAFDSTDTYELDGAPLVPCATGSTSPSCTTGGTHSLRMEDYSRIQRSGAQWLVWDKLGTKRTYTAIETPDRPSCPEVSVGRLEVRLAVCPPAITCNEGWTVASSGACEQMMYDHEMDAWWYRRSGTCARTPSRCQSPAVNGALPTTHWGLTQVADTHGNTVDFTWSCPAGETCYPKTVRYTGTLVTLYYELRPDPLSYANGSGFDTTVRRRLKTIAVTSGSAKVRAWRLTYGLTASGRSALREVRQYGNDYVLDADGDVTGGSSLPPLTATYGNGAAGFAALWPAAAQLSDASGWSDLRFAGTLRLVDVNGDGKLDVCGRRSSGIVCWLSTGTGLSSTAIAGPAFTSPGWDAAKHATTIAYPDVNGDGKSDVCGRNGGGIVCYLSTGAGFSSTPINGPALSDAAGWSSTFYYSTLRWGDVNGDGKDDLCGRDTQHRCWLSTGSAFTTQVLGPPADASNPYIEPTLTDVNGDGRADLCMRQEYNNTACWLSTGTAFGPQIDGPRIGFAHDGIGYPDVDGDGRSDTCGVTSTGVQCFLSDGNGLQRPYGVLADFNTLSHSGDKYLTTVRYADINGDGRSDFCARTADGYFCWPSTGTGFGERVTAAALTDAAGWDDQEHYGTIQLGDVDGDGRPDLCARAAAGFRCALATGEPELLATVTNGIGGATSVSYTPSTAWANTRMPVGLVTQTASALTTSDGRGASDTVSYRYEGGLWSASERRFLGFAKVTGVVDAAGNFTETHYHQHAGCIAKPEATYFKDASGRLYSYTQYDYTETGSAPYRSLLTGRWDYQCELQPAASCRKLFTELTYDNYGNIVRIDEHGDWALATDDRATRRGYYPNTAAYIVGLPGYENVYDSAGTLVRQWLAYYDANTSYSVPPVVGELASRRDWDDKDGHRDVTRFEYDAYGNRTAVVDPAGRRSTTTYDAATHTLPIEQCEGVGRCVASTWHPSLRVLTRVADPNGAEVLYTYDAFGRVTRKSLPLGGSVQYEYLGFGNPSTQRVRQTVGDGAAGLWSETYQDGLGREYKNVRIGGATQLTEYSGTAARVLRRSEWFAAGETPQYETYAYEGAGRPASVTHADGTRATITYQVGGSTARDELGHEKVSARDAYGRLVKLTEKVGTTSLVTTYLYDALDRLVETVDAKGNVASTAWDSRGNRTSWCELDRGCGHATYGPSRLMTTATDAKGQTTSFTYDAAGRMVTRLRADGELTRWTYDEQGHGASFGRVTTVTDGSGSESLSYDESGRVVSQTKCIRGSCYTTAQSYDVAGRPLAVTYPDGEVVTNTYSASGDLVSIPGYLTSATYDARGQLKTAAFPNGTVETFAYDARRKWLTSAAVTGPGGQLLYQASYTYDAEARVKTFKSSVDAALDDTYTYDELDRLKSVAGPNPLTFTYDALGNMLSSTTAGAFVYGSPQRPHAPTSVGGAALTWDANGNLLSGPGGPELSTRTLAYDAADRPVRVTLAGTTADFAYDHQGQRVWKSVGGQQTRYVNARYTVSPAGATKYYTLGGRVIAQATGGVKRWVHSDHLGSVRLVTSAAGTVVNRYRYSAFGAQTTVAAGAFNDRGFGGQVTDPEAGLVYMNARYYDPALAHFVTADTVIPELGNPQSHNRYAFALNNPISNVDPTGHVPVAVAFVAAITATTLEVAVVAWAAFAATTLGYVTKDPFLTTLGMLLSGVPSGPFGVAIAVATSPLSPLSPKMQAAIRWVYTAYGVVQTLSRATDASAVSQANSLAREVSPSYDGTLLQTASTDPSTQLKALEEGGESASWGREVREPIIDESSSAWGREARTAAPSVNPVVEGGACRPRTTADKGNFVAGSGAVGTAAGAAGGMTWGTLAAREVYEHLAKHAAPRLAIALTGVFLEGPYAGAMLGTGFGAIGGSGVGLILVFGPEAICAAARAMPAPEMRPYIGYPSMK